MDDPDYPQGQEEKVVGSILTKKKKSDSEEDEEDEEEEEDEDGNPIPKKAPEPVVVKKDFSNRVSSEKDTMIEILKWSLIII